MSRKVVDRLLAIVAVLVLVGALVDRLIGLDHIPGISGDEAFYGIQAYRFVHGQPRETRTPTGLPLNPLFWSLEIPLLILFRPAGWILRAPAVLCGSLAVVATYLLLSRLLDRLTAFIAAVALAVLPVAIGYARFGWDQSQAPLFSAIALACALRGDLVRLVGALGLLLLVHLANIFVLPAVLVPFWVVVARDRTRSRLNRLATVLGSGLAAVGLLGLVARWNPQPRTITARQLAKFSSVAGYLNDLGRFFTGDSLYDWLAEPVEPALSRTRVLVLGVMVLLLLPAGTARLIQARAWERLAVVVGLGLGLAGLYVGGGPTVLSTLTTRYGLALLVPTLVAVAILLESLLPRIGPVRPLAQRGLLLIVLAAGGISLADFHDRFFEAIRETGGRHIQPAFRTAPVEPKQQALAWIRTDIASQPRPGLDPHRPRTILADDWWTATPLTFLALGCPEVKVELAVGLHGTSCEVFARGVRPGSYAVGFEGGRLDRRIRECFPEHSRRRPSRHVIPDYAGNPLIVLYRFDEAGGQSTTAASTRFTSSFVKSRGNIAPSPSRTKTRSRLGTT